MCFWVLGVNVLWVPRCCSCVLPWGQGYNRIYQIYEQMSFASECREQAREDAMLQVFHMFRPFFRQIRLSSMFKLKKFSRVFGLRVQAMCPAAEGNTPWDLKPGERMGAPPMGQQGSRGYGVVQAEEPHTGVRTHAYGYRETVGAPPLVDWTQRVPQVYRVHQRRPHHNNSVNGGEQLSASFVPIDFFVNPSMGMSGFGRGV